MARQKWVHKNVYGARPGKETWESSWTLQARFEEVGLEDSNRRAAALDDEKYFDMFDVEFETERLEHMGYPKGLAKMQRGMYSKLKRHIKFAGCYGESFTPTNGLGQGCSLTLIAANAAVTTEFNMLDAVTPRVEEGADIDDRSLSSNSTEELMTAVHALIDMDGQMGQTTNVKKSRFLATDPKESKNEEDTNQRSRHQNRELL